MSNINFDYIKKLRDETGLSILECKSTLEENNGDYFKTLENLKRKSKLKVNTAKPTSQGVIVSYIHSNNKVGVMIELMCETDFVANNEQFRELAHNLALHIAATNPSYLSRQDIPANVVETETQSCAQDPALANKPANIIDKIISGKLDKYYTENCLLDQLYIKDEVTKISELINEASVKFGENIQVGKFVRLSI